MTTERTATLVATSLTRLSGNTPETTINPNTNLAKLALSSAERSESKPASTYFTGKILVHEGVDHDPHEERLWEVKSSISSGVVKIQDESRVTTTANVFQKEPETDGMVKDPTFDELNLPFPFLQEIGTGNEAVMHETESVEIFDTHHNFKAVSKKLEDNNGRAIDFDQVRFVDRKRPYLAVEQTELTANYEGVVEIKFGIDPDVDNGGYDFYEKGSYEVFDQNTSLYTVKTKQNGIDDPNDRHTIVMAQKAKLLIAGVDSDFKPEISTDGSPTQKLVIPVKPGEQIILLRLINIHTEMDQAIVDGMKDDPVQVAKDEIVSVPMNFDMLLTEHWGEWENLFDEVGVQVTGDDEMQQGIDFSQAHLIAASHPDSKSPIGARLFNLIRKAYGGHGFWDIDNYVLPVMTEGQSEAWLEYRYRQLLEARKKAIEILRERGVQVDNEHIAFFPWESSHASYGESTPKWVLNARLEKTDITTWKDAIHINADVALGIMNHFWKYNNEDFHYNKGAQMLLEGARFYRKRATEVDGMFDFHGVVGPDEYHEKRDRDAYTNIMAKWACLQAVELAKHQKTAGVRSEIGMTEEEIADLEDFANRIHIDFDPITGVFNESSDWKNLIDIDFHDERSTFHNIKTIDAEMLLALADQKRNPLIHYQELEGIDVDDPHPVAKTKVLKQPSGQLAIYQLGKDTIFSKILTEEHRAELRRLNPKWTDAKFGAFIQEANHKEFNDKISKGSSLSETIMRLSALDAGEDPDKVCPKGASFLRVDLDGDNSTGKGLKTAYAGGIWQFVVNGLGGLRVTPEGLQINPKLPSYLQGLTYPAYYEGNRYKVEINQAKGQILLYIVSGSNNAQQTPITVHGKSVQFDHGENSVLLSLNGERIPSGVSH